MAFIDFKSKTRLELEKLLFQSRADLQKLRFKVGEGQLKNPHQIKHVRQQIAHILTLINQPVATTLDKEIGETK